MLKKQFLSPGNSYYTGIWLTGSKLTDNLLVSRRMLEIRSHGFTQGMEGKYGVKLTAQTENITLDLKGSD